MAQIRISYEEVIQRYPALVAEIENKLRRGRSKEKNRPLQELDWWIYWCTCVKDNAVVEERWCLQATKGRWWGKSTESVDNPPKELTDELARWESERRARQKRVALLSPEDRQAELLSLLRGLAGPGFMAVGPEAEKLLQEAQEDE